MQKFGDAVFQFGDAVFQFPTSETPLSWFRSADSFNSHGTEKPLPCSILMMSEERRLRCIFDFSKAAASPKQPCYLCMSAAPRESRSGGSRKRPRGPKPCCQPGCASPAAGSQPQPTSICRNNSRVCESSTCGQGPGERPKGWQW